MTRDAINAFGDVVKAALLDGDHAILISVGARVASVDCDLTSCTATIEGGVGKETKAFTGNAVNLNDAIWIARGKLREDRSRHQRRIDEAKATGAGR